MADRPSRREERYRQSKARDRRRLVGALGLAVAGAVVLGLIVASSGGGGDGASVAQLTLGDFTITGDLDVAAGDVRLEAVNQGKVPHNVGLRGGPITSDLRPGETATLDLGQLTPGTYELYCDLSGHVERGMVATLTVTGAPAEA